MKKSVCLFLLALFCFSANGGAYEIIPYGAPYTAEEKKKVITDFFPLYAVWGGDQISELALKSGSVYNSSVYSPIDGFGEVRAATYLGYRPAIISFEKAYYEPPSSIHGVTYKIETLRALSFGKDEAICQSGEYYMSYHYDEIEVIQPMLSLLLQRFYLGNVGWSAPFKLNGMKLDESLCSSDMIVDYNQVSSLQGYQKLMRLREDYRPEIACSLAVFDYIQDELGQGLSCSYSGCEIDLISMESGNTHAVGVHYLRDFNGQLVEKQWLSAYQKLCSSSNLAGQEQYHGRRFGLRAVGRCSKFNNDSLKVEHEAFMSYQATSFIKLRQGNIVPGEVMAGAKSPRYLKKYDEYLSYPVIFNMDDGSNSKCG